MPSVFSSADKDAANYKFWHDDSVRFNDLDALGHVSSVNYNIYFAGARTKLFKAAIPNWPDSGIVPVLRSLTIDFESELHYPAAIKVGLKLDGFGTTSFTLTSAVFSDGKCIALCRNVFIVIDTATRGPVAVPDAIKSAFTQALA